MSYKDDVIKLAALMREGSKLVPKQATADLFEFDPINEIEDLHNPDNYRLSGACALGCALIGYGYHPTRGYGLDTPDAAGALEMEYTIYTTPEALKSCGIDPEYVPINVFDVVTHLNDTQGKTVEEIAQVLECVADTVYYEEGEDDGYDSDYDEDFE